MLEYDIDRPASFADGDTVAVLLHGRGSHRGDLQPLRPHLPEAWALVTPQAPNPGAPWGYGPGWAWYRYVGDDRVVDETLAASLAALDAFLASLPDLLDAAPGRVVLGGFSQGGTTSLTYGLRRPGVVHAVLNFSGFLPDSDLAREAVDPGLPVFWGHGTQDPAIPHALAVRGRQGLAGMGVAVEARDYDIGHWIEPDEMRHAVAFVEREAPGG